MKHILSYTEKMLLETVINFDSDFENTIKNVFKGSDYEYIINDLLKLKDKDIDVKSNKPTFLIKGNIGINSVNITDKDNMKFSKLIGLLVPNLTSNDIKNITDIWVGSIKQDLKEVKGDKIKYYYQRENTEDIGDTELKDSCMIDKDKSLLDIYTSNTDNIKLLIKLNEVNKLSARALLFNTLEKGWCMSRVYFNRPSEQIEFNNYAKDNDIYILTTKRDWDETLTVQLKESEFKKYPYIDHFQYLNLNEKQLSTTYTQWEGNKDMIYELRETNGSFKVIKNEKFIKACKDNNIELVKELLKDESIDPTYMNNYSLHHTISNGYVEIVKMLMKDKRIDIIEENSRIIRDAIVNRQTKILELLLKDKRIDTSVNYNDAIYSAIKKGQVDMVKLLAQNKKVIQKAKKDNDSEILNILKRYGTITERKKYR